MSENKEYLKIRSLVDNSVDQVGFCEFLAVWTDLDADLVRWASIKTLRRRRRRTDLYRSLLHLQRDEVGAREPPTRTHAPVNLS